MEKQPPFLQFLPINLFGAVMGLTGLSFCWERAAQNWGMAHWIKDLFAIPALVIFLLLTIAWLVKWARYPGLVKTEFEHPVSVSFFATFAISLLLLPGILIAYSTGLAVGCWCAGAVLIFIVASFVMRKWLSKQQDPANAMPAWILPVVGTLDVPIVGYRLPIPGIHEICLLFFGIGLIFALILLTVIFSRLLFQPSLPEALQPTLLILVGPSALAFSGYEALSGAQDITASILFYFTLFMLLVFGSKIVLLPFCCPFRVTWWAVSFPLVAATLASFRYASHKTAPVFQAIPAILLLVSTVTIAYLLLQSLYKLFTHRLLLPQPAAEKATQTINPA